MKIILFVYLFSTSVNKLVDNREFKICTRVLNIILISFMSFKPFLFIVIEDVRFF